MANPGDYIGSIAQNFISFATTFQINAVPGANFNSVLLFVGSGEAVAILKSHEVYTLSFKVD